MSTPGITDKQETIWRVIRQFALDHDIGPTMKEIRTRSGMPSSIFFDRLLALEAKGFIERHGNLFKALAAPHEQIIGEVCASCGVSFEEILTKRISQRVSRARRMLARRLKQRGYRQLDIAKLLNVGRSWVSHINGSPQAQDRRLAAKRRAWSVGSEIAA